MADDEKKASFGQTLVSILILGALLLMVNSCDQSGAALQRQLQATTKAEPAQFVTTLRSLSTLANQHPDRLEWDASFWVTKPSLSPAQKLAELSGKALSVEGSLEVSPTLVKSLMDEFKALPKIGVKPTFWARVLESALDDDD